VKLTVVIIEYVQNFTQYSFLKVNCVQRKLGIINMNFDVTDELLIRLSSFVSYWRRNGIMMGQYISYL